MADINNFEHPKLALIRLLRSQGCCDSNSQDNTADTAEIERLTRYKQQLETKLQHEKQRLNQIPCVITLAEEVQELTEVIYGLTRQNQDRLRLLENGSKTFVKGHEINEAEEMIEHERLQSQYSNLLKSLEMTNDINQNLVRKLTNI